MLNIIQSRSPSASLVILLVTSGWLAVSGQFLPQSHLGRLVQSITSPLVLSGGSSDSSDPYGDPSSYYSSGGGGGQDDESSASHAANNNNQAQQARLQRQQVALQQAPSQQRGVPQHYYGHQQLDDERDQGSAPSNNKHTQDYQMGAYLGPSMDDKELNGAFNSNNDERDDDDGPASYDGGAGRSRAAASNAYHNGGGSGYGPALGQGGRMPAGSYNDEDGADEDEPPVQAGRGRRPVGRAGGRNGLSQAASQYQQQGSYGGGNGPLMAAANGFAGYGFNSGPADLAGLMAGMGGADQGAGYQAYQGDGSYPGANYYQQQQVGQRGGRAGQAASAPNGYYNGNQEARSGALGQPGQEGSRAHPDGDERDSDADED